MTVHPSTLLNQSEAAERLRVSKQWLAVARMQGTGPEFVKIGRRVLYPQKAIDAFIAENTRTSTSHAA